MTRLHWRFRYLSDLGDEKDGSGKREVWISKLAVQGGEGDFPEDEQRRVEILLEQEQEGEVGVRRWVFSWLGKWGEGKVGKAWKVALSSAQWAVLSEKSGTKYNVQALVFSILNLLHLPDP